MDTQNSSTGRLWLSRVLLVVVVGAPAAASWHGLTAAGEQALGLPGAWSVLVPLVLDGAALYAAVLALRDVLSGDAAAGNRALVWAYALFSAGLNAWYADRVGGLPAALFYALASVSAVILWDRTLRALRRDALRAQGAVQPPTPRFRVARWVVAPGETARAWRVAVIEGITDPADAVQAARALRAGSPVRVWADVEPLAGLSKADAVRRALDEAETPDGRAPRVIAEWLADRGVDVAHTYVSDVIRRDSKAITTTDDGGPLRLAAS